MGGRVPPAHATASASDGFRFLDDRGTGLVVEAVEDARGEQSVATGLRLVADENSTWMNTSFGSSTLRRTCQPLDAARAPG